MNARTVNRDLLDLAATNPSAMRSDMGNLNVGNPDVGSPDVGSPDALIRVPSEAVNR